MIKRIKYALQGRSFRWSRVRKNHLNYWNFCAACESKKELEVHHIVSFHVAPELELDTSNLITLCDKCHLVIGHLRNFKLTNPNVIDDALTFATKRNQAIKVREAES